MYGTRTKHIHKYISHMFCLFALRCISCIILMLAVMMKMMMMIEERVLTKHCEQSEKADRLVYECMLVQASVV